ATDPPVRAACGVLRRSTGPSSAASTQQCVLHPPTHHYTFSRAPVQLYLWPSLPLTASHASLTRLLMPSSQPWPDASRHELPPLCYTGHRSKATVQNLREQQNNKPSAPLVYLQFTHHASWPSPAEP
ncbi:MAG: hypothetical protein MI748_16970, partial [Opitutales bacterium]|nr:hypothetical protein [Opitutales bacterium]